MLTVHYMVVHLLYFNSGLSESVVPFLYLTMIDFLVFSSQKTKGICLTIYLCAFKVQSGICYNSKQTIKVYMPGQFSW